MGFRKFSMFCSLCLLILTLEVSADDNSLLMFKSEIVSDPENALDNWSLTSGLPVCKWTGIKCSNVTNKVVQLDLSGYSLQGTISPALGNLSSLLVLDLSKNFFTGIIPREIGSLINLRQLSLSWNALSGNIPNELGSLRQLIYLDLESNKLEGEIPSGIFCNGSSFVEYIDLSNNSLTGEIPLKNECELPALRFLLLWSNRLVGLIPQALSKSTRLEWLDLESNNLTGELPASIISNMPRLQFLYLSYNQFVSHDGNTNLQPFFTSLVNSSNFQELELAGNSLSGEIPSIIGRLTNAVEIHLDGNQIYGSIPPQISNLVNLTLLNLSSNFLNGTLPLELTRMQKLERVYLSNNLLSGEVPSAFGNLPHLGLLDLSKNKLSGAIPDSFSNLTQLRKLLLYGNELSGTIPPSLGKCPNLEILDLSQNRLSGVIPIEVAALRSLKLYLNLSRNRLYGELPLEISKMDMVLAIDLSCNNFSGKIPPQLGSCIALEYLNLSNNSLEGHLPDTIGQLPYLKELDVSSNSLVGRIPGSLQVSSTLKLLNLSFNQFSGNVSNKGAFSSLNIDSFLGNKGLCGSIKGMPSCKKIRIHYSIILPIILSLFATPVFCIYGYPLVPLVMCAPEESKPADFYELWRGIILELIELGLMCTQYNPLTRPSMVDVANEMGRLKQYLSNPSSLMLNIEEEDLKVTKISNASIIKSLEICQCYNVAAIELNNPELSEFKYHGRVVNFSSNVSALTFGSVDLTYVSIVDDIPESLRLAHIKFLSQLNQWLHNFIVI
ncbi:hypothetical protein ACFE04_008123 [Oxalis oulophora]